MGSSKAVNMDLFFYLCLSLISWLGVLILQELFLKPHQRCVLSPATQPETNKFAQRNNRAMLDIAEAFFWRDIRYSWSEIGINHFAASSFVLLEETQSMAKKPLIVCLWWGRKGTWEGLSNGVSQGPLRLRMRLPVRIFFLPAYKTGLLYLIHRMWK